MIIKFNNNTDFDKSVQEFKEDHPVFYALMLMKCVDDLECLDRDSIIALYLNEIKELTSAGTDISNKNT